MATNNNGDAKNNNGDDVSEENSDEDSSDCSAEENSDEDSSDSSGGENGDWESDYRYRPDPLFEAIYRCLPFSKYKYPHLETGNKIIMPLSALTRIDKARLKFPLIFEMEGFRSDKISHCGVLEFEAEEGFVYMPEWMMQNLGLEEGADVTLRSSSLSRGTYMKLQPHTTSFIELSDPKAVLEMALRGFSCLSCGDTILVKYCDTDFYIDVVKVGPGDAVRLIDTDCEVDFAPPLDYKEPQRQEIVTKIDDKGKEEGKLFRPFVGIGRRIDGVVVGGGRAANEETKQGVVVGGGRAANAVVEERKKDGSTDDRKKEFKPFTGRSHVLR